MKTQRILRAGRRTIKSFVLGLLFGFLLMNTILINSRIVGSSMEPTLHDGQSVLGVKTGCTELHRGDIISFHPPGNDAELYIKRIIGMPGDMVVIVDGNILVNGKVLDEPYIYEWTAYKGPYVFDVPDGKYLVLGDNRDNSYDSRSWEDPYVPYDRIVGKIVFIYYPFRDIKAL